MFKESRPVCVTLMSDEHEGFLVASVIAPPYADVSAYARDPVLAEALAWQALADQMIKRTKTIAYKAVQGGEFGDA